MPTIDEQLTEIEELIARVKPAEAEQKLLSLMYAVNSHELQIWEPDLRRTIGWFHKKRRTRLESVLCTYLNKRGPDAAVIPPAGPTSTTDNVDQLETELRCGLADLSQYHIFQWSTFYRDFLANFFGTALDATLHTTSAENTLSIIHRELAFHANEIFAKGFEYQVAASGHSKTLAVTKSLSGLQRFMELPIELYSAKLSSSSMDKNHAISLRRLSSAMLSGILEGYGAVQFDMNSGWALLPRYPRSWAHYLGFLVHDDLADLMDALEPGALQQGLENVVSPLVGALDDLITKSTSYVPLPALGLLTWDYRRLDISLRPPPHTDDQQLIEIQCYLDSAYVSRPALQEALSRDVSLIAAPLRADLKDWVSANPELKEKVVSTGAGIDAGVRQRLHSALEFALYKRSSPRIAVAPLTYNFARGFPLHNPFLTKYFHVYRSSVRDLLRTFERRNGVRLWCSVRRSGKTTACFDLGTTTGLSVVVSQTCAETEQQPDATIFYDLLSEALQGGQALSKAFLRDAVSQCAIGRGVVGERYVLVLDEYETLFGRLRLAAKRDAELRYTVVQPLLNQMVAFARDNLLVFVGQQPDAHFILMDQNQLSAYVQQDAFPLFQHSPGVPGGELWELVAKVLTDRVVFDATFVDAIYEETAGHPFLTVKMLVAFVDWLIEQRRQMRDLRLRRADFEEFDKAKLTAAEVSISPEYVFFREAVTEAIGPDGKKDNPWLYAVYSGLRALALRYPSTLRCTRTEFADIVEMLQLPNLGISADYLLSSGAQANFFEYDGANVSPRIRLLARISAIARHKIVS